LLLCSSSAQDIYPTSSTKQLESCNPQKAQLGLICTDTVTTNKPTTNLNNMFSHLKW